MPAPKGHPKWGGRKKGTPNKATQEVEAIAARLNMHPFEVLLLFAKGDWQALGYESEKYLVSANDHGSFYKYTIDPAVRARCAAEATQYLSPKRKAVEHTGEIITVEPVIKEIPASERIKNKLEQ